MVQKLAVLAPRTAGSRYRIPALVNSEEETYEDLSCPFDLRPKIFYWIKTTNEAVVAAYRISGGGLALIHEVEG